MLNARQQRVAEMGRALHNYCPRNEFRVTEHACQQTQQQEVTARYAVT